MSKKDQKSFVVRVAVVGAIFSITAFLILADANKEYESSVSILVVTKSEALSKQSSEVVENISEFPKTLSFYDRLLRFNPQTKDPTSGENQQARRNFWNKQVEVSAGKSEKRGTIINLSVFGKTPSGAEELSRKTTSTLFEVVSNFYNIKTDIQISILDGPLTSVVLRGWYLLIFYSILIGFAVSLVLNLVLNLFDKKTDSEEFAFEKSPLEGLKEKFVARNEQSEAEPKDAKEEIPQDTPYHFKQDDGSEEFMRTYYPDQLQPKEEIEKIEEFDKAMYPNFPEIPTGKVKEVSAPDNLPIAGGYFEEPKKQEEDSQEPSVIELKKDEPTDEELRERLNKLLRGDL